MTTALKEQFHTAFEAFFDGGHCYSFSKGRTALYAGLKALDLPQGSEIILPAYTCVVVASAIIFAGYKPIYVDIDPQTYNLDPKKLPKNTTAKALIAQHSYGVPADMDSITTYCKEHNLILIEDCCHTMASRYKGQLCGTFGAFSFFSGQWNKFFSTGLGGFFYTRNDELAQKVEDIFNETATPSSAQNMRLWLQIMVYDMIVRPKTTALITQIYRKLSKTGITTGSSNTIELNGQMPEDYFLHMAPAQLKKAIKQMETIDNNINHRRKIGDFYQKELSNIGVNIPFNNHNNNNNNLNDVVSLRIPICVSNRKELLARAIEQKIELGDWFTTPLHGNEAPLSTFGYQDGQCPIAETISQQVINLPTHQYISQKYAEQTIKFIKDNARLIS